MLGTASPQPSSTTRAPARGGAAEIASASDVPLGHGRAQNGTGRPAPPSSWRSASQSAGSSTYTPATWRTATASSDAGSSDTATPRSAASCSDRVVRTAVSAPLPCTLRVWHSGYPAAMDGTDQEPLVAIVEIPKGSSNKYEWD